MQKMCLNNKMRQEEEVILIEQIVNGNIQAFRKIVEKYEDMVFTICLRIVRNREIAMEVAQDVFLKTYNSLEKFRGTARLSTWIYRIAYNTSLNASRKKRPCEIDIDISDYADYEFGSSSDAQFETISDDIKQMVEAAIMLLDETDRIIITLYYYDDLSISEISDITGISKSNVKVRLFRSRNKLSEMLKNKVEKEYIYYEYN